MRAIPRIAVVLTLALVFGCSKDPHDPQTWIDRLDDPAHLDEAVRNLERLKDPVAIKPLGEVWRKYNKPSPILRTIIAIATWRGEDGTGEMHLEPAVPYLKEAVEEFDPGDERSIQDAMVAADALGKARDPDSLQVLISAAQKAVPKLSPANAVRIAAIGALGNFKDPRATDVLIKILQADPEQQRIQLFAAAALSLAEVGSEKAVPALIQAMYAVDPIFSQVERALTAVGKPAAAAMKAVLQGKDAEVNKIAKERNFDKIAPGAVRFKSAMVLGSLRARDAVPVLLEELGKPGAPQFIDQSTGLPGPSTHEAVLRALQRIGDPRSEGPVCAYAFDPKTDDVIRPMAIDVCSWLTSDGKYLTNLLGYIKDENQDDQIWYASVMAYGRIAGSKGDIQALSPVKATYEKKIKLAEKKIKEAKDAQSKQAAEAGKQMNEGYRIAIEQAVARIETAMECKKDAACYAKAITSKDAVTGKPGLPKAERAFVELYRMGDKAQSALDALLQVADSHERILREGVGLALPRIAPLPCKKCVERLDQVIEAQKDQQSLDALTAETTILRNYFRWAGT